MSKKLVNPASDTAPKVAPDRTTAPNESHRRARKSAPPVSSDRFSISAGDDVQSYRLLSRIGSGSMGMVWRAHDARLDREVAIKFLQPDLGGEDYREKFLKEARAMARVSHPNVVAIFAFGSTPYLHLVMEFIEGVNLADWIESEGGLVPDVAIGVLQQICRGVEAMHQRGIVHHDLKPANVLIGRGYRAAVTDFGLAHVASNEHDSNLGGTPFYMAPEIVLGDPLAEEQRHLPDVYSLGVMAFEMLTNDSPFDFETVPELLKKVVAEEPRLISDFRPELGTGFDEPIRRAMERDLKRRTPSVDAFMRDLMRARDRLVRPLIIQQVLVIDDDPTFCAFARVVLEKSGDNVRVHVAQNGEEGAVMLEKSKFDLVLLDLDLPGLTGFDLTEVVRKAGGPNESTHLAIVTATADAEDWKRLSDMGADSLLLKPVRPKQLMRLASRVLDHEPS